MVTVSIAASNWSPYTSKQSLSQNSYHLLSFSIFRTFIPQHSMSFQRLTNSLPSVSSVQINLNLEHTGYAVR